MWEEEPTRMKNRYTVQGPIANLLQLQARKYNVRLVGHMKSYRISPKKLVNLDNKCLCDQEEWLAQAGRGRRVGKDNQEGQEHPRCLSPVQLERTQT